MRKKYKIITSLIALILVSILFTSIYIHKQNERKEQIKIEQEFKRQVKEAKEKTVKLKAKKEKEIAEEKAREEEAEKRKREEEALAKKTEELENKVNNNATYNEPVTEIAQESYVYVPEQKNGQNHVGSYQITAYTDTGYPMANGEYPYVGCAASCDFPIGTVLTIEGIGTYVIKDVCPTSGVIDIYMTSYDECIQFGRRTANVYI